jgi:hypothetical protein
VGIGGIVDRMPPGVGNLAWVAVTVVSSTGAPEGSKTEPLMAPRNVCGIKD